MSRHRREIAKQGELQLILLFLFFRFPAIVHSLPCEDKRCKTDSCDDNGACICNLPDPSTILDGDRPFLGGKFCNEEHTMCDGTNSFWCGHGSRCNEIVQGENYTCSCLPGYAGDHCEHVGAPCGQIFCFHEAECLVEWGLCECPPDWKGSVDCSLPTTINATTDSTDSKFRNKKSGEDKKGLVFFLSISLSLGVVVAAIILAKKYFNMTASEAPKFQQLSEIQVHRDLDGDEDDALIADTIQNDRTRL